MKSEVVSDQWQKDEEGDRDYGRRVFVLKQTKEGTANYRPSLHVAVAEEGW